MEMKLINKTANDVSFIGDLDISLLNAIRRSVDEVPILAVDEVDIYKNDSALYDEVIAHRLGLVVLKNQKLKKGGNVEMKLKIKGKGDRTEVLAGELGDNVIYPDTLIAILDEGKEMEFVARANMGIGITHAKYSPGVIFYKHLPKLKITSEGEKQTELAEIYPETFELFGEKIKVKDASKGDIDLEDMQKFPGVEVSFDNNLVVDIESWGQMDASSIFIEACSALKENLVIVSKALK